jgi:hypothetical protein
MIRDGEMRGAAAELADEARENYGGVDVISVEPV